MGGLVSAKQFYISLAARCLCTYFAVWVDSGHAMKCRESWVIEGSSEDDGGEVKLVED